MTDLIVTFSVMEIRGNKEITYSANNLTELLLKEPHIREEVYDEVCNNVDVKQFDVRDNVAIWKNGSLKLCEPS